MTTSSNNLNLSGLLAGKVAVVTGSSRGIGRAVATAFAAAGADVLVHAQRSRHAAEDLAQQLRGLGVESRALLADLAVAQERASLVAAAWQWRNRIDVWVNNAGADVLTGDAGTWPFAEKLERLWAVDVLATIDLSRLVGQGMEQSSRGGTILNMGWDQAEQGMAGDSGQLFAAAKGAVMAFSRSLAQTLAPAVRVNCLAPGWIRTQWGDQASAYWQQRARHESLLGRWGTPEDVARVACFLASDLADFINGQTVAINGGFRFAAQ